MTIKRKLQFSSIFFLMVLLFVCASFISIFRTYGAAKQHHAAINQLFSEINQLNLISIDFAVDGQQNNPRLALRKSDEIKRIASSLFSFNSDDQLLIEDINKKIDDLTIKLSTLAENNQEINKDSSETDQDNQHSTKEVQISLLKEIYAITRSIEENVIILENSFHLEFKKFVTFALLEIGSLSLLLIFLIVFIQYHLSRRLGRVADAINKIADGDLDLPVPETRSHDEIGLLAKAVEKVSKNSTKAFKDLDKKIQEKTQELTQIISKTEEQNKLLSRTEKATLNILEDIKDEKDHTENIAKDLEKFMLAVESTSDNIIITTPKGSILYVNPALEKTTGFSKQELLGKKINSNNLWGGTEEGQYYEELWTKIRLEKKPFTGEIKNKSRSKGEYWTAANISPIIDEDGDVEFIVGIERNITKEKQVDKAKTEFVSLASHQLRTPLSSINWYSEMLLSGDAGEINPEQREYLEEINEGNQRMTTLVNSLLNVSRIELGTFIVEPEEVDIPQLAQSVIKELAPQLEKKEMNIESAFDGSLPKINADPKLLRMVFQNLLSNATKYTLKGGKVIVTVKIAKKGSSFGGKNITSDSVLISVEDNGIGIPGQQQNQVFLKLFRADNAKAGSVQGTGLGLYIIKSIVDHSGGKIWFTSVQDRGTTFFVILPLEGMKKKEGTKQLG